MPRFFDDYSNTYLTHDSAAGRKQQRRGWKFRENFRLHYEKNLQDWRSGPNGLASAQQAFMKAVQGNADGIVPPLPDGWVEETDQVTRTPYYVHEESGRRAWVRPGFRPPPVAPPMMRMGMQQPPPSMMGQPPPPFNKFPPNFPKGVPPPNFSQPPPAIPHNLPPPPKFNLPPPPSSS